MTTTVSPNAISQQRRLPDTAAQMAKAEVRKPDLVNYRRQIATEIVCPLLAGLTLKEVAGLIYEATGCDVDERQIARWKDSRDRPQFDLLIAVPQFRPRLLLLWAAFIQRLTKCVDCETTIRVREVA
jgi:hypothetical protein